MTKYVITDPCYITSEEVWDECLKDFSNFSKQISEHLTQVTGEPAYACDTGFGDWSNGLISKDGYVGAFGADSGMVCVCKVTDDIEDKLGSIFGACYCIFEAEGPLDVVFDTSDKSWTVVYIEDVTGNEWQSLTLDDEE